MIHSLHLVNSGNLDEMLAFLVLTADQGEAEVLLAESETSSDEVLALQALDHGSEVEALPM